MLAYITTLVLNILGCANYSSEHVFREEHVHLINSVCSEYIISIFRVYF